MVRFVSSRVLAAGGVARTFESSDPLVGDLANAIEKQFPGRVSGVNVLARDAGGVLRTDFAIELDNAIIQVKSGGGSGIGGQVTRTRATTDKEILVYGPNIGRHAEAEAIRRGARVFRSHDNLLRYIGGR